jgi:6-phosphofructokinase 1
MTSRTLLVGQSGGATAVINATLAGVIESARQSGSFDRVLGLRNGTDGLLTGAVIDLTDHSLANLRETPGSALGTTRRKTTEADRARMLDRIRDLGATGLVLIGGNDSADTAHQLGHAAVESGLELSVALAPKTVDNDLRFTDHCPGYASAARVLANIVRDATFDTLSSPDLYPIKLIEVMGRDAGWLAGSTALGFNENERDLQPLIFFPESRPESAESAMAEIMERFETQGWCVAVLPETLKTSGGDHLSGAEPIVVDPHGHPYHPSAAESLCRQLQAAGVVRARYERPGSFVRASGLLASPVDRQEAYDLGWSAAARVAARQSDIMVTLDRISDEPYQCAIGTAPLREIANLAREVPEGFIAPGNRGITDSFRTWAGPLLGPDPFPAYGRLDAAPGGSTARLGQEI